MPAWCRRDPSPGGLFFVSCIRVNGGTAERCSSWCDSLGVDLCALRSPASGLCSGAILAPVVFVPLSPRGACLRTCTSMDPNRRMMMIICGKFTLFEAVIFLLGAHEFPYSRAEDFDGNLSSSSHLGGTNLGPDDGMLSTLDASVGAFRLRIRSCRLAVGSSGSSEGLCGVWIFHTRWFVCSLRPRRSVLVRRTTCSLLRPRRYCRRTAWFFRSDPCSGGGWLCCP
jgi:hypothetical protein